MNARDSESIRAAKKVIRGEVGAALRLLTPDERDRGTDRAFARLEQTEAWCGARRVMLYAPLSIEPSLDRLWARLGDREVGYPRIADRQLEVRTVSALTQLRPAAFGLREPDPGQTRLMDPAMLDLVVVPGLAFTRGGDRLGRGAGYYDRFLATLPPKVATAALAFACQLRDTLPIEAHDQRVQMVFVG